MKNQTSALELHEQVDIRKNLSWKIESINNLGKMKVKFNQTMKTEGFNISQINNTVLNMFIDPNSIDPEVPKDLNFTWNAT